MSQFLPFYGAIAHVEYDSGMFQTLVSHSITIEATGPEVTDPPFNSLQVMARE